MEKQALAKPTPVVTHVLSQRNMQWYLGTQVISLTGMMLRQAVLSLLMIDLVGVKNAPPLVGMIWALNVLPGTIMGIFAGMMVDHFDKRRILQTTAVLGIIQGLILVYITRGRDMHNLPEHIAIWKIMSVMLFTGITNAIDGICRNAIVADAVLHEENKSMGSIIFSCLYTFGMVLGNGLAGWLVENIGYSNTFILNASSFLFLIIGLSQMSFKHNKTKKKDHGVFEGALHRIKIGILYTFTHKGIRICILVSAAVTIFGFAYNVILSIIAKDMFHGGKTDYSFLAAIAGVGSLAGSVSAILWSDKIPKTFIAIGCTIMGLGQIVFSQCTSINQGAAAVFLCGFGFMSAFSPLRGSMMRMIKKHRTGIVLGITFTFFYGGMMASSLIAGFVAKRYNCQTVLLTCGSVLLLIALVMPFLPGVKEIGKKRLQK